MEINQNTYDLLSLFHENWELFHSSLRLDFSEDEIRDIKHHPLKGELINLVSQKASSLPFFLGNNVVWCTVAPNSILLKNEVEQLQAWILPSYGWQDKTDGYKASNPDGEPFLKAISQVSPGSYFRWRCIKQQYSHIERKLAVRRELEMKRPERVRYHRPSLYELRIQFQVALVLGNFDLAKKAIESIDTYELDKALNTQMMRIRLWHHFREFELIKNYRYLPNLQAQNSLPMVIQECIREALGKKILPLDSGPEEQEDSQLIENDFNRRWELWFNFILKKSDLESARSWLEEKGALRLDEINAERIESYSESWDSIFMDDELREMNKQLINEGIVTFLGDFVREPEFPRKSFSKLYLSLMRLWKTLNAGIGRGREEGHVLLELANALFQLNYETDEAKSLLEEWWETRPVPSQLPFALDAIELLSMQHPDAQASEDLWFKAADLASRNPHQLVESEKKLWRETALHIGFDAETITQYFPIDTEVEGESEDILASANLNNIAIVSMRERPARGAAEIIQARTGANVFIVSGKTAGPEVSQACKCDVVLYVWLATTHAVFRAFDGFARNKLCYVQGAGSASIVRTLERWVQKELTEKII